MEHGASSKNTTNHYGHAICSSQHAFAMKVRKLCNILGPEPEELNAEQRKDLLSASKVGAQ